MNLVDALPWTVLSSVGECARRLDLDDRRRAFSMTAAGSFRKFTQLRPLTGR